MADNGATQSENIWPLPKFYFQVDWGSDSASFQEVTGLDVQSDMIEYRSGDSPVFSTVKMPGLVKTGNVSLKKGVFTKDNKFFEWFSEIKMNTIERRDVTISLLDETGSPTMVWSLSRAWPTKVTSPDLKSDGNEVAIESIEIVHEGITISNG